MTTSLGIAEIQRRFEERARRAGRGARPRTAWRAGAVRSASGAWLLTRATNSAPASRGAASAHSCRRAGSEQASISGVTTGRSASWCCLAKLKHTMRALSAQPSAQPSARLRLLTSANRLEPMTTSLGTIRSRTRAVYRPSESIRNTADRSLNWPFGASASMRRAAASTTRHVWLSHEADERGAAGPQPHGRRRFHLPQPQHRDAAPAHPPPPHAFLVDEGPRSGPLEDDRGRDDGEAVLRGQGRRVLEDPAREPPTQVHLELEVSQVDLAAPPQPHHEVEPSRDRVQLGNEPRLDACAAVAGQGEELGRPQPEQLLERSISVHGPKGTTANGQRRSDCGPMVTHAGGEARRRSHAGAAATASGMGRKVAQGPTREAGLTPAGERISAQRREGERGFAERPRAAARRSRAR